MLSRIFLFILLLGSVAQTQTPAVQLRIVASSTPAGFINYLSDLNATLATNGWGPIEKDKSNGENQLGDGASLTLNTIVYLKGLGVHAFSDIRYNLGGQCTTLEAVVGVDDEISNGLAATIIFQVFADGIKIYDSGIVGPTTPARGVNVDITGASVIQLLAIDGGDGISYDHGDWANARVICDSDLSVLAPPTGILVSVGDTWQNVFNAGGIGATFTIASGIHRDQSNVQPLQNQVIIGQTGAILSGAKLLTGAIANTAANPPYWYYPNQTQGSGPQAPDVDTCEGIGPYPNYTYRYPCADPEDVYLDNVLLEAVHNIGEGGPGKFFFDYPNDRIYIWDNPSGRTVETIIYGVGIQGLATGVTISNLIIEKYADSGASIGNGWELKDCEIRYNHFRAVFSNTNSALRRCNIHHNGAEGLGGAGSYIVIDSNEIHHNNTARFNGFNHGGGSKWVYTDHLTVSNNWSHHNGGPGLWTDINNGTCTYAGNTIEDNYRAGIFHEIGYSCSITNNIVRRNGCFNPLFPSIINPYRDSGWPNEAGIAISTSGDVTVTGNTVTDNCGGSIAGIAENRGSGNAGPWSLSNLNVSGNTITIRQTFGNGRTGIISTIGVAPFTTMNNRFESNTYYLGTKPLPFWWSGQDYNETQWQATGNDSPGGVINRP